MIPVERFANRDSPRSDPPFREGGGRWGEAVVEVCAEALHVLVWRLG